MHKMEATAFDLVLIDLHMPEMDGITAAQEIRRRESEGRLAHANRIAIIPVSADVTDSTREACKQVGLVEFIAKPYNRQTLIQTVAHTLAIENQEPQSEASQTLYPGLEAILDMVSGEQELAAEVLREFLDRTPHVLEAIDHAFEASDHETIARHAHTLKGSLLTLGFDEAGGIARRLESSSRKGQRHESSALISQLHQANREVETVIRDFLQKPGDDTP
jgi:CheY-like chemotaxis protein